MTLPEAAADGPDTDEMVALHRIFRRELPLLCGLVQRAPRGNPRRAEPIARHLEFTLTALHHHHTNEDEYLFPLLLQRAQMQADVVGTMESQHKTVDDCSDRARRLVNHWRRRPSPALSKDLAATLAELSRTLDRHLDDEEVHILPLVREHLSVAEWEELGQRWFEKFPRTGLPIMLGQLLESATDQEAAMFLGKHPRSARVRWRVSGRRRYVRYIRRVRGEAM